MTDDVTSGDVITLCVLKEEGASLPGGSDSPLTSSQVRPDNPSCRVLVKIKWRKNVLLRERMELKCSK